MNRGQRSADALVINGDEVSRSACLEPPSARADNWRAALAPGTGTFEVSGVDRGSEQVVRQRLNVKLRQAAAGNSNLPALVGVVGFKARLIAVAELEG